MFVQENCLVVTEIHFQTSTKFRMISREIPPGVKGECGTQAWPSAPAGRGENQSRESEPRPLDSRGEALVFLHRGLSVSAYRGRLLPLPSW